MAKSVRVLLSSQQSRAVFVVQIPPGSTAYQANDGRYYGRSEFEAKYLPDHEVRLRMSRGKVARAIVLPRIVAVDLGIVREDRVRAEREKLRAQEEEHRAKTGEPLPLEIQRTLPDGTVIWDPYYDLNLLSAKILPDAIMFDFVLRNDGELTIRAPAVEFMETRNGRLFDEGLVQVKSVPTRLKLDKAIIYPGDEQKLNAEQFSLECTRQTVFANGDYTVSWKVFLDNSPPSFGEIDLANLIETARKQSMRVTQ